MWCKHLRIVFKMSIQYTKKIAFRTMCARVRCTKIEQGKDGFYLQFYKNRQNITFLLTPVYFFKNRQVCY